MFESPKIDLFSKKVNLNNQNDTDEIIDLGNDDYCPVKYLEYRKKFIKDGFVKVPNVFSSNEMNKYEKVIKNAVMKRTKKFNQYSTKTLNQNKSFYDQQFTQCLNLWEDDVSTRHYSFHQKTAELASSLLGVDCLRLWQDQSLFKSPGSRETSAHLDQPFWPINETNCITAWIPLEGSNLNNGALGYVPGSHLSGIRHFSNISTGKNLDDFRQRDKNLLSHPRLKGQKPIFIEANKGDIVFHHGLTIHLSKPNTSKQSRSVHTVVYFKNGSTRGSIIGEPRQKHFVVDRTDYQIGVGDLIDSDLTPIAYPIKHLPATPFGIQPEEFMKNKAKLPFPFKLKSII